MTQERAGAVPLRFEQNLGQNDEAVRFVSRGQGFVVFPGTEGATVVPSALAEGESAPGQEDLTTRIRFPNSNPQGEGSGFGGASSRTHYYLGDHESLYPGVGLMYRSNAGRLEFDFLVDPGVGPDVVKFRLEGAGELRVDGQGNLVRAADLREIVLTAPLMGFFSTSELFSTMG